MKRHSMRTISALEGIEAATKVTGWRRADPQFDILGVRYEAHVDNLVYGIERLHNRQGSAFHDLYTFDVCSDVLLVGIDFQTIKIPHEPRRVLQGSEYKELKSLYNKAHRHHVDNVVLFPRVARQ